jgi:hypothetical protein
MSLFCQFLPNNILYFEQDPSFHTLIVIAFGETCRTQIIPPLDSESPSLNIL